MGHTILMVPTWPGQRSMMAGATVRWNGVANLITVSRILVLPLFVWFVVHGRETHIYQLYSGFVLIYMIVSDALDGAVARLGGDTQGSHLGQFLDPLADKICGVSCFVTLTLVLNAPPVWFTALVIARVIFERGGWVVLFVASREELNSFLGMGNILAKPNLLGKASNASHAALLIMIVFDICTGAWDSMYIAAGIITVAAGFDYVYLALRQVLHYEELSTSEHERKILENLARSVRRFLWFCR